MSLVLRTRGCLETLKINQCTGIWEVNLELHPKVKYIKIRNMDETKELIGTIIQQREYLPNSKRKYIDFIPLHIIEVDEKIFHPQSTKCIKYI